MPLIQRPNIQRDSEQAAQSATEVADPPVMPDREAGANGVSDADHDTEDSAASQAPASDTDTSDHSTIPAERAPAPREPEDDEDDLVPVSQQQRRPAPRSARMAPANGNGSTARQPATPQGVGASAPSTTELRRELHKKLIEEIDQGALAGMPESEARSFVQEAAQELVAREVTQGLGGFRERLLEQLVDDVLGLGPIEPLLRDPSIAEIMVNGPSAVYIERAGRLSLSAAQFRDDAHVVHVIERILAPTGRQIDEANPLVDARLPDGSRVNAVIPPASTIGPLLTIRKFVADRLTSGDLIKMGSLSEHSAELLSAAVDAGLNIIVSGGTGSGKTTMLNVLSEWIPATHRIVTIEDPTELSLRQPHVVSLEARPGAATNPLPQSALLKNALRMRPDRIIVGEVRGSEAFDMLQAMNTGHEGSMSTVHANTPRDAVRRIENMVMMAGFELPIRAIREQIASALDIIVQIARMRDGTRRVVAVSEVVGMEGETITMQDLYLYDYDANELVSTGIRAVCAEELESHGFAVPLADDDYDDDYDDNDDEEDW